MPAPRFVVPIAVGALAAISLLAPFAPLYDPWAWLIWGRELVGFDLDTSAGPSWKPLPALVAALVSPAGGAAPELWLLIARAGWLAAAALAYRLAWRLMFPVRLATGLATRFAPRRVRLARNLAGAIAAIGVLLLFDPFTSWWRQFAGGLSEPLLVALVLGAIDRELSERRGQALALGFAAALLRPEVWPLLVVYGVWLWRGNRGLRPWLVAGAIALPALWLGIDLAGSGDPLTGAERAREGTGTPLHELVESIGRSLELPLAGLWAGVAIAVVTARRHRERQLLVIAWGAAAWIGIVAVLAAIGYAGLPRFAAPAAAVACVLGGIGIVRLLAAIDGMRGSGRARPLVQAAAAAAIIGLTIQGAVRAAEIPGELDDTAGFARGVDDLDDLVASVGRGRLTECPPLTTNAFLTETALAWQLEVPIVAIDIRLNVPPRSGTAFVASDGAHAAAGAIAAVGSPIASAGEWTAYEIACGPDARE